MTIDFEKILTLKMAFTIKDEILRLPGHTQT